MLIPEGRIIAFAGAGGKTSALYALASHLCAAEKRIVVTTTTHMQYPDETHQPLCTTAAAARAILDGCSGGIAVCGTDAGTRGGIHRISGLAPDEFTLCRPDAPDAFCDVMLVEADGARMLPLKAPADNEPVIPSGTEVVAVCAGLSACGKMLEDICFRQEAVARILKDDGLLQRMENAEVYRITPEAIAHILFRGYIGPEMNDAALHSASLYVVINQADTPAAAAQGAETVRFIERLVSSLYAEKSHGTLLNGMRFCGCYITSFLKGEYQYEPYRKQ